MQSISVQPCRMRRSWMRNRSGKADIVLADVPCSGLGVIGKKQDIKYKMSAQRQQDIIRLQRRILSVVQDYVKPGGRTDLQHLHDWC